MGIDLASQAQNDHFILVHGASHGAWCWYKVRTLLEQSGQRVTCIDLKGAGIDGADPNTVFTMEDYNQPLFDFLSGLPDNDKVILVGHSIGGATVTAAVCMFTSKITMAVYVAAAMEKPEPSAPQVNAKYLEVSESGNIVDYTYELGTDQEPTGVIMKKQYQRGKYYNKSPQEDATLASMLLRPAPYRAFVGAEKWPEVLPKIDAVPRVFVKTMRDHVFNLEQQDETVAGWPPCQFYCLDSDHSAFFSNPIGLFDILLKAAASLSNTVEP